MEYTLFILLLPFLSFLILGLAGMKMKHQIAGAIGTASLLGVTALSYMTAFDYFTAGRTAEGVYPALMPFRSMTLTIMIIKISPSFRSIFLMR